MFPQIVSKYDRIYNYWTARYGYADVIGVLLWRTFPQETPLWSYGIHFWYVDVLEFLEQGNVFRCLCEIGYSHRDVDDRFRCQSGDCRTANMLNLQYGAVHHPQDTIPFRSIHGGPVRIIIDYDDWTIKDGIDSHDASPTMQCNILPVVRHSTY